MLTQTLDTDLETGEPQVKPMTMIQALRSALDVMMQRSDDVVVFGQDVGYFGGVFRVTEGLQAKYGKPRCFDTPISEGGIVGVAVGMAAYGLRPVADPDAAAYDAIVIAVGHRQFHALGAEGIRAFGKPGAVIYDVKYVLPRDAVDGRL